MIETLIDSPINPNYDSSKVDPSNLVNNIVNHENQYGRNKIITKEGFNPYKDLDIFYNEYSNIHVRLEYILKKVIEFLYNIQEDFITFKSINPEKYKEAIKYYSSLYNMDLNLNIKTKRITGNEVSEIPEEWLNKFSIFFSLFSEKNIKSPFGYQINKEKYFKIIDEIRSHLYETNKNIDLDIEHIMEFEEKYYSGGTTDEIFLIKIRPKLVMLESHLGDTHNVIPVTRYRVCLDFDRIFKMVVKYYGHLEYEEEPESIAEDLDTFTAKLLDKMNYGDLCDRWAKYILIELLDTKLLIMDNWNAFVNKFENISHKISNSHSYMNLEKKVSYLSKEYDSNMSRKSMKNLINTDHIQLSKIITYYKSPESIKDLQGSDEYKDFDRNYITDSNSTFIYRLSGISTQSDFKQYLSTYNLIMFDNTFTHYFTNITGYTLHDRIYKEFNRSHDIIRMKSFIKGITSYDTRDFYFDLFNVLNKHTYDVFNTSKLSSGEYKFFMFSKLKRNIWLYMSAMGQKLGKLINKFHCVQEQYKDSSLYTKTKKTLYGVYEGYLLVLFKIANESGINCGDESIPLFSDDEDDDDVFNKIRSMIIFCNKYVNEYSNRNYNGPDSDAFVDIAKVFLKKQNRNLSDMMNSMVFCSYDTNERNDRSFKDIHSHDLATNKSICNNTIKLNLRKFGLFGF